MQKIIKSIAILIIKIFGLVSISLLFNAVLPTEILAPMGISIAIILSASNSIRIDNLEEKFEDKENKNPEHIWGPW